MNPVLHSSKIRRSLVAGILAALGVMAAMNSCMPPPEGAVVYRTYVPPSWAPPYDGINQIRYYYLPDYEMFYDVWDGVFCYQSGAVWICSPTLPQMYATVNLYGTFIVLIHRDLIHPWDHFGYFERNYPRHCYEHYGPIVEHNRIVPNIPRERRLVPRAFNENTNRVTFMQEQTPSPTPLPTPPGTPAPAMPRERPANQQTPPTRQTGVAQPAPAPYGREADEVPMRAIAPSMPGDSREFNYGSGYSKPPSNESAQAPRRAPAPSQTPQQAPSQSPPQAPRQSPSQAPSRVPGGQK